MNIATIQGALENWVQAGLSLPESNLLWANQGAPVPKVGAWVSMRIADVSPVAEVDSVRHELQEDQEQGEEVLLSAEGLRSLTFSVQAFTRKVVVGNSSAVALLAALLARTRLPTSQSAFAGAGISLYRTSGVTDLSALEDQAFEGRALLEFFFYAVDSATERTGFIETVGGTVDADAADIPFQSTVVEE